MEVLCIKEKPGSCEQDAEPIKEGETYTVRRMGIALCRCMLSAIPSYTLMERGEKSKYAQDRFVVMNADDARDETEMERNYDLDKVRRYETAE